MSVSRIHHAHKPLRVLMDRSPCKGPLKILGESRRNFKFHNVGTPTITTRVNYPTPLIPRLSYPCSENTWGVGILIDSFRGSFLSIRPVLPGHHKDSDFVTSEFTSCLPLHAHDIFHLGPTKTLPGNSYLSTQKEKG